MANLTPQEIQYKTYLEYRIANKLATPDERMKYQDIVNKEKGITGAKKPTNTTADYYADKGSKASATPSVSRNAPANASAIRNAQQKVAAQKQTIYDKGAAQQARAKYTEQMQKGRVADADTSQQYNEAKNKVRNINPTADAITVKQVDPKTASKFDSYLANVKMLKAQRSKLLQNRGKMPPAEFDKQLEYIDDAIARIRRTAQDEGVYSYAITTNRYSDFAYLIGHDDGDIKVTPDLTAGGLMGPEAYYANQNPRGIRVVEAKHMYDTFDPVKAADKYIAALWAEYKAANAFNKVLTASGYPEGYDFSNDKTPFGKTLRKAYDNYINMHEDFEIATTAVKQKLASSDDTYANQFLKSFYERCKNEIALSPEDSQYIDEVLQSLDPTAYDESTHAKSNKEIMSDYDQAKREMEGV